MKSGFFKENGRYIGKLLRTHIAMSIFGTMVYVPFTLNDSVTLKVLRIAGGVLAVILYMFLIDVDMWYYGAEDKLRVDAGRQKRQPLKGLWIGLIAQIPSFIIGALFVISWALNDYYGAYESGAFFAGFELVMYYVNLIWNGMYHGIQRAIFGGFLTWFYLIIPLLPALFSALTYYLGLKNSPFLKPPAREKRK